MGSSMQNTDFTNQLGSDSIYPKVESRSSQQCQMIAKLSCHIFLGFLVLLCRALDISDYRYVLFFFYLGTFPSLIPWVLQLLQSLASLKHTCSVFRHAWNHFFSSCPYHGKYPFRCHPLPHLLGN